MNTPPRSTGSGWTCAWRTILRWLRPSKRGGPVRARVHLVAGGGRRWPPGGASSWWLHQSLAALDAQLRAAGSRLVIRRGPTLEALRALAKETGAGAVFWNRRYEPAVIARDAKVKEPWHDGLDAESFNAALLHEPWTIQNQSGKPFQVFTPFWRHCLCQARPGRAAARAEASGGGWLARVVDDGLDAQSRADDCRIVSRKDL